MLTRRLHVDQIIALVDIQPPSSKSDFDDVCVLRDLQHTLPAPKPEQSILRRAAMKSQSLWIPTFTRCVHVTAHGAEPAESSRLASRPHPLHAQIIRSNQPLTDEHFRYFM